MLVVDSIVTSAHNSKITQPWRTAQHSSRGTSWLRASSVSAVQLRPVSAVSWTTAGGLQRGKAKSCRAGKVVGASVAVDTDDVSAVYKRLQNGSDVRGVALPGIPNQPVTLTTTNAAYIAQAFAGWLAQHTGLPAASLRVSVGRDPRLSGEAIAAAAFAGLAAGGAAPSDMGLCTTPACFMSCITDGHAYDASIMLTASHLPWNRNGMKFFTKKGGLGKADIKAIVEAAARLHAAAAGAPPPPPPRAVPLDPFLPVYAAQLRGMIASALAPLTAAARPLEGFKIAVDAGNGGGGFFASMVLAPLGADVSGSQFLEPDGNFPNHIPNPEEPEAVESAARAVLAAGADLGIIFDTDVDRSAVIDRSGKAVNRNRLIALLAAIVLRDHPGATIVTDSVTSDGLAAFIAAAGGVHHRFKRGYKNVIDEGLRLAGAGADVPLMIETSGHGAMAENYYLDDGAYLAVKVVIEAARRRLEGAGDVSSLLASLQEPLEEEEFRMPIAAADFGPPGAAALEALRAAVQGGAFPGWELEPVNHEGYRIRVDEGGGKHGWLLLRQSLHDPLLVLNVESLVPGGAAQAVLRLKCWMAEQPEYKAVAAGVVALEALFEEGGKWAGVEGADSCEISYEPHRLGGGK